MEKKKIICLFLFVVLILVSFACHSRKVSDIKPVMTKERVISLWGSIPLITQKNVDGLGAVEIWEYHFESSDTICSVIFVQNRVARTECRLSRVGKFIEGSRWLLGQWHGGKTTRYEAETPLSAHVSP